MVVLTKVIMTETLRLYVQSVNDVDADNEHCFCDNDVVSRLLEVRIAIKIFTGTAATRRTRMR